MVLVNVIISLLSSRPVNKHNKERSEMMSSFGGFIKEVLSAFHIIKTNNLETTVTTTYTVTGTAANGCVNNIITRKDMEIELNDRCPLLC